jgi:RES domain-containing protein
MESRRSGPLRAYRIADSRHPLFDGQGAMLFGGRWNSPGRRVIYAAETYAGAMLEVLAHANIGRLPKHHAWIEITIPEDVAIEEADPARIAGWDAADLTASRAFGDAWYDERRSAVLIVPSMVTRVERNILIHQQHPDFARLSASAPAAVEWDKRLIGR